jgi:hypothetical protein
MFARESKIGRSANTAHKFLGVVSFVLSAILLAVVWFGGD